MRFSKKTLKPLIKNGSSKKNIKDLFEFNTADDGSLFFSSFVNEKNWSPSPDLNRDIFIRNCLFERVQNLLDAGLIEIYLFCGKDADSKISALFLGMIKCPVREGNGMLYIKGTGFPGAEGIGNKPDRTGFCDSFTGSDAKTGVHDSCPQPFGEGEQVFSFCFSQDHQELFTTPANHQVIGPGHLLQDAAELFQY